MPHSLVYIAFFASLPTLLLIALLATINARQELREIAGAHASLIPMAPSSAAASFPSAVMSDVRTLGLQRDHALRQIRRQTNITEWYQSIRLTGYSSI
ncbi:hypothetical protein OBBRIDRAFT_451544 [Obba rivulosa]|uniref:Uncharacterized protein n=1 Tax=Obba rivulosa TaxID=1052685 RepID=A0A8E2DM84_9APHY|nr:hypothetical protein OBBRIDRAFT_451544 [Obba rivulosa]